MRFRLSEQPGRRAPSHIAAAVMRELDTNRLRGEAVLSAVEAADQATLQRWQVPESMDGLRGARVVPAAGGSACTHDRSRLP